MDRPVLSIRVLDCGIVLPNPRCRTASRSLSRSDDLLARYL